MTPKTVNKAVEVVVCTDEHPCTTPKIQEGLDWQILLFIALAILSMMLLVFRRR